jgi:hypothetical protein
MTDMIGQPETLETSWGQTDLFPGQDPHMCRVDLMCRCGKRLRVTCAAEFMGEELYEWYVEHGEHEEAWGEPEYEI